ncbi:MAG: VanW family protein [Lachnospiraceae bacterium]|nr:VanW family protein [Lachnospiraceae bacterium]
MMKEKGKKKRNAALIAGEIAVLLLFAYMILCFEADSERILPHTIVNEKDLSGMTWEEAAHRLNKDADARRKKAVIWVDFQGQTYEVAVGNALEFDGEALAREVLERSKGSFLMGGITYLKALLTGYQAMALPEVKNMDALYREIEASGLSDADSTVQTSYQKEGDSLVFQIGTAGEAADITKLAEEILEAVKTEDYQSVIECPKVSGTVKPVDIEQVYWEFFVKMKNADLNPSENYAIVEGVRGVAFDREKAQKALEEAKEGERVTVDLIYTEPEVSAADLEENLFKDLLASYSTNVTGSYNRLFNIQLAVEKCENSVILAGEEFSFNDTVGDQNEETGFLISDGVENGKIVPAYGGGICQLSSTIFLAALYADMEIVERWNHDLVARYVPAGLDAAVAWGELDLRIANNTLYPIQMEIINANGVLTVNLWGTRTEDKTVKLERETVSSAGEPLEVLAYRIVYDSEGNQIRREQVAHSRYV